MVTSFTSLRFNKWGMKPGFILINNDEFIQIDEGKTDKVTIKNFKI